MDRPEPGIPDTSIADGFTLIDPTSHDDSSSEDLTSSSRVSTPSADFIDLEVVPDPQDSDGTEELAELIIDYFDEIGLPTDTREDKAWIDSSLVLRFKANDAETILANARFNIDHLHFEVRSYNQPRHDPGPVSKLLAESEKPIHEVMFKKLMRRTFPSHELDWRPSINKPKTNFISEPSSHELAKEILSLGVIQIGRKTFTVRVLPDDYEEEDADSLMSQRLQTHTRGATRQTEIDSSTGIENAAQTARPNTFEPIQPGLSPQATNPRASEMTGASLSTVPTSKNGAYVNDPLHSQACLVITCKQSVQQLVIKQAVSLYLKENKIGALASIEVLPCSDPHQTKYTISIKEIQRDISALLEEPITLVTGATIHFSLPGQESRVKMDPADFKYNAVEISRLQHPDYSTQHLLNVVFLRHHGINISEAITPDLAYDKMSSSFTYSMKFQDVELLCQSPDRSLVEDDESTVVKISPIEADLKLKVVPDGMGHFSKGQITEYFSQYPVKSVIYGKKQKKINTATLEFQTYHDKQRVINQSQGGCHTLQTGLDVRLLGVEPGAASESSGNDLQRSEHQLYYDASSSHQRKFEAKPKQLNLPSQSASRRKSNDSRSEISNSKMSSWKQKSVLTPTPYRTTTNSPPEYPYYTSGGYRTIILTNLAGMSKNSLPFLLKTVTNTWPTVIQFSQKTDAAVVELSSSFTLDIANEWKRNLRRLQPEVKLDTLDATLQLQVVLPQTLTDAELRHTSTFLYLYFNNAAHWNLEGSLSVQPCSKDKDCFLLNATAVDDVQKILAAPHSVPQMGKLVLLRYYHDLGPCGVDGLITLPDYKNQIADIVSGNRTYHPQPFLTVTYKPDGADDIIILRSMLQNKTRSHGGQIKDLKQVGSEQFTVYYKDAEVAKAVHQFSAESPLMLKGQTLGIELVSPDLDEEIHETHRVRIGDIPETVSKEYLQYYLSALSEIPVKSLFFNAGSGDRAVAEFEHDISDYTLLTLLTQAISINGSDMFVSLRQEPKLAALVMKTYKPLDKHFLESAPLALEKLLTDALECTPTVKVEPEAPDQNVFIVDVEPPEFRARGLNYLLDVAAHGIDILSIPCHLQPYCEWLGLNVDSEKPIHYNLERPTSDFQQLDPNKFRFLSNHQLPGMRWFQNELKEKYILWDTEKFSTEQNISREAKKMVHRNWNKLSDIITDLLTKISSEEEPLPRAISEKLVERCTDMNVMVFNPQSRNQNSSAVVCTMVGLTEDVTELRRWIATEEESLKREQEVTSLAIPFMKDHQLNYLEKSGFIEEMVAKQNLRSMVPDRAHHSLNMVGHPDHVDAANREVIALINSLQKKSSDRLPGPLIEILRNETVMKHIQDNLEKERLMVTWDFENGAVTVWSHSSNAAQCGLTMLTSCLVNRSRNVDDTEKDLLTKRPWTEFQASVNENPLQKVLFSQNSISMYCFYKNADNLWRELNLFFATNITLSQAVEGDSHKKKCLILRHKEELLEIARKSNVKLECTDANWAITMTASKDKVTAMSEEVSSMLDSVKERRLEIIIPAMQKYFLSNKREVEDLGFFAKAVVMIVQDSARPPVATTLVKSTDEVVYKQRFNGLTVEIRHCDITSLKVDAIVNAANQKLKLLGGVAGDILRKGGRSIQETCDRITKSSGKVMVGSCEVTTAGNLPCKHLIHAVGPKWQGGSLDEAELLDACIATVLDTSNQYEFETIAMPVISSGIYGFPAKNAARIIANAIVEAADNADRTLRKVIVAEKDDRNLLTELINAFTSLLSEFPESKPPVSLYEKGPKRSITPVAVVPAAVSGDPVEFTEGRIHLAIGEIEEVKADVFLVSGVGTGGLVATALARAAGGTQLADALKEALKTKTVPTGGFLSTSGFDLCNKIYFCSTPSYTGPPSEQALEDMITAVLKDISANGHATVAMPAFGTGNLKYPPDISARVMFDAVEAFFDVNSTTSLKQVRIVIYHKDLKTRPAFESRMKEMTPQPPADLSASMGAAATAANESIQNAEDRDTISNMLTINNTDLIIQEGDITTAAVEAIVNSTNHNMYMKGATSKSIVAKLDRTAVAEIHKTAMPQDGVIMTDATGQLSAKKIVHVNSRLPKDGDSWISLIENVFNQCEAAGISSVAFPALATGAVIGKDSHRMSTYIIKATVNHMKSRPKSCIKQIRVVIFKRSMVQDFLTAMNDTRKEPDTWWQGVKKFWKHIVFGIGIIAAKETASLSALPVVPVELPTAMPLTNEYISCEKMYLVIYSRRVDESYEHVKKRVDAIEKAQIHDLCWMEHNPKDAEIIRKLQQPQLDQIEAFARGRSVNFKVQLLKRKNVKNVKNFELHGLKDDVREVEKFISDQIIDKIKEDIHEDKQAELLAKNVKWERTKKSDGQPVWEYVGQRASKCLEDAFVQNPKGKVKVPGGQGMYWTADLNKSQGSTNGEKFEIRRCLLQDRTKFPERWTGPFDDYSEHPLAPDSEEFKDVESKFRSTLGSQPATILEIKRIQNPQQFLQFVAEQEKVAKLLGRTVDAVSKSVVWHGAAWDSIQKITRNNFNRSFAGTANAVRYGQGSYFARDSEYSYGFAPTDSQKHRRMIMAKIVVGDSFVGDSTMKTAPYKPDNMTQYNSTVDDVSDPKIFVVYSDPAAYPEYVITFS